MFTFLAFSAIPITAQASGKQLFSSVLRGLVESYRLGWRPSLVGWRPEALIANMLDLFGT